MNLLPLETFRHIFSIHPFHFWQLANFDDVPVTNDCDSVVYEYGWQNLDASGRVEIRDAIETAEAKLLRYLGYRVAPQYTETTVDFPRYNDHRLGNHRFADSYGRWLSVQLPEGEIRAIGVESLTLIGSAVVIYSDQDTDGLDDTFTLSIATAETDPDKIAVYFAAADRLDGDAAGDKWRIEPVKVEISGGTASIRGRSWMLVKPVLYQGVTRRRIDPTVSTNFVASLEVYIRTTDPDGDTLDDSQAVLIWETSPYPYWFGAGGCCGGTTDSSTDPAAVAKAIARVGIRDAKHGIVSVGGARYDSGSGTWSSVEWGNCRPPDRILIRYLAGLPLVNGQMDQTWQKVVAHLGGAELQKPICACKDAYRILYNYQFDLSRTAGNNDEAYNITAETLNNPIGPRRGQVEAWRVIQEEYITRGFSL